MNRGWLRKRSRAATAGFVAGVAAFALLVGGGAAFAFWTANATGSATVKTAPITLTVAPSSLDGTLINTHTSLKRTGSFTVANTSATPGDVSASISSGDALAANLPIRIWPSSAAACTVATPPASATSGTWAAATAPTVAGVAAGASVVYCVRTDVPVASRPLLATATGAQSAAATITASLASAGWTGRTATTTATQKTSAIYPLATTWLPTGQSRWYTVRSGANTSICLDAAGSGTGGVDMISYGCTGYSNQAFEAVPVSTGDHSLVRLRPAHAAGLSLSVTSAGRATLATTGAGDPAMQQWWVQSMPNGRTQLVSASDGKCLVVPAPGSTAPISTADCPATAAAAVLQRIPVTFTSGTTGTVSFGFLNGYQDYRLQYRASGTSGAWTTASTTSGTADSNLEFNPWSATSGNYDLRIVDKSGEVTYSGMTVSRSWTGQITAVAGFG